MLALNSSVLIIKYHLPDFAIKKSKEIYAIRPGVCIDCHKMCLGQYFTQYLN